MRLATPSQIAEIEKRVEREFKISPEILMEIAGTLAAREIQTSFLPELQRGRVAVICGPGNNGADGMVTARHLVHLGFLGTEIFLVGDGSSPLYNLQLSRIQRYNLKVTKIKSVSEIDGFDLYIDALFGVGLSRPLNEMTCEVISRINSLFKPIISLDLPSGLDGLSGQIYGACVHAHLTLTFGLAKPGLYTSQGAEFGGRIRVVPIGFPQLLVGEIATTHFAINEKWTRRRLPVRKINANKFNHGRLYIAAGAPGTWGAAALCCQGAYRMGAGYVTLVTNKDFVEKYLGKDLGPEVLLTDFSDSQIKARANAVVVGPGSGKREEVKKFILTLVEDKFENVVLDADALTILSEMKDISLPKSWVLTPHTGELSRLLKVSSEEIESDRLKWVSSAARKWGCNILLKGFRSILASPEGVSGIIISGNAALAKAGTGDVLSGFIGALLAQGLSPFDAGSTGAYIHGRIADTWVKSGKDMKTLLASDLVALVSDELRRVEAV